MSRNTRPKVPRLFHPVSKAMSILREGGILGVLPDVNVLPRDGVFVPFFGTLLSTTLPALFVLTGQGYHAFSPFGHAMLVVGLGVVIHLIEGNIVSPLVMSRKVDLPPVLTIMSVLIIGQLLGGLGLIVALPTLVTLMVIVRRILISRIYEGQGFRRTTRERALILRVPAPGGGVIAPPGAQFDIVTDAEASGRSRSAA